MQCACAILPHVACPALLYVSTLSHIRHDFGKKKLLNTKYVSKFSTNLTEKFLILRRLEGDIIINVHRYSCKVPAFLVRF
jgi:hypothetical protein